MESIEYPDLGATVFPAQVPDGVLEELPDLYGSLLSSAAWFATEDQQEPTGACLLQDPRHALVFFQRGDTVEILNKEFEISPECVVRACRALFRALPGARRIHIEVLFPPPDLRVPKRVLYWADHMVVDLPDSVEAYTSSLGKSTRRELRRKDKRLRMAHPDVRVRTISPQEDAEELVATLVEWKNLRFNSQGKQTVWQQKPEGVDTFVELVRRTCEVRVTHIDGRTAAVDFVAPVGRSVYAVQSAFDPRFEQYSLGLLSAYGVVCDAVSRGFTRVSMLWGTPGYKTMLGATPRRATRLSLFRTQPARLHSLDEAWEVARRNAQRRGQAEYWRLRHAAGRRARAARPWLRQRLARASAPATTAVPAPPAPADRRLDYPDLGAVVHTSTVPKGPAVELPALYGSLFSTMDWFVTHDDSAGGGVCLLERPRHVLVFDVHEDTVDVLNKAFAIAPKDAERACRALFRAFPQARRIHLEVMFRPGELTLPTRTLYWTDHMIVDLPATVAEYVASLGRSTRRNLRLYENRVHRDHPDLGVEVFSPGPRSRVLVERFLAWKTSRFRDQGRATYWEQDPALAERFIALLERCGEAHVTTVAGEEVAISFAFPVGNDVCSQETSFDPRFERYHLGLLAQYWVACDAVRRGARSLSLLWGTTEYKERLGAVAHRATALSVFRGTTARLWSADEAVEVARRRLGRAWEREYWRARHTAGRLARRVTRSVPAVPIVSASAAVTTSNPSLFPDLGAAVFADRVPGGVVEELPGLYSSLPSTLEWFLYHDRVEPQGACLLERPRHALLYRVEGDTVEVLNKTFRIEPADAARACTALFRALPTARRIHLEVMFPPSQLRLPSRPLNWADHMVADLPGTIAAYNASLGSSTRRNLRRYEKRLRLDHPALSVQTVEPGERSRELFDLFLEWKRARFAARGQSVMWDTEDGLAEGFVELVRSRGEALVVSSGDEVLSIVFAFPVGKAMYAAQAAYRPDCDRYHLGLLTLYWLAGDAMRRGFSEINFMWGTKYYKERLGARPVRATRVSVFRTQLARLHSLDEAREFGIQRVKRAGDKYYWRTRHAAGRAARDAVGRLKPSTADGKGGRRTLRYADLGAVVQPAPLPDGLPQELDELYGSLFSTLDWFETHDDAKPAGACILEAPRHVLVFTIHGDTVGVLNKAFEISPRDARRACAALFRAFPQVRRIHLEVMFPPPELRLPHRVLYWTDHMIVELAGSVEDYTASLGKSMRRNVRSARNRLHRDHPDATTTVVVPGDAGGELLEEFLAWKRARFQAQGRTTYWDDDPALVGRFIALLRRRGEAHVTTIDGRRAAINFVFPVGDTFCAQESSFDPQYSRSELGLLGQFDVVINAVERGATTMNLLWGSASHKQHFGAVAHRATALSVFRDQTARLWSPGEAVEVARRRLRRAWEREYWRTRHAAGRLARAAAWRVRPKPAP